jgi:K(+)-stimulated pyrophosphate-energized sodium pump
MAGLAAGFIIGLTTEHFTGDDSAPVVKTAAASQSGAAINVITGFAFGLRSVMPSLAGVAAAAVVSYELCAPLGGFGYGVFGIAMAALGMLAIVGLTVSNDAYGPIVDNARGIVEQAGLDEEALAVTDRMDAAGNAAKAVTKGFAIGAAGLTVLALLATFRTIAGSHASLELSLLDPWVLGGVLVGLAVPSTFSARVILGVSRNAHRMIDEVRRQFREIPGLREGAPGARPDYDRCIALATSGAMAELLPASLAAVGVTLLVGLVGGLPAMGGCLGGAIFGSLPLGLMMANAGGLWDNAKKRIEGGAEGGRGSQAHHAAVVGDTVGDPFKDTAGPSLNTMVAAMSLIATLLADTIGRYNLASWISR